MSLSRLALSALCLLVLCGPSPAQEPPPVVAVEEFSTKLEAMLSETGTVIVKGHTRVGSMTGSRGTTYFTAWEVLDARSGRREQGISIDIGEPDRPELDERPDGERAFIDYDEIGPLLKGLEYLSKLSPQVTKLSRYEAQYQTRGGLRLMAFHTSNNFVTAISTGGGRRARFILRPTGLAEFRTLI
ncbi:MAG TPA: hypothetical protein VEQ42_09725 [Pyrinomonadaceae bacterium]|nr:hypothetical protein [Pyrinomonadaceae bacterium]